MPPKRTHEDPQALKEKLHSLQGNNARGRRNGNTNLTNGSNLKEVVSSNGDNASTNSGQNEHSGSGMKWNNQDASVLQGYRRAYRLETPSTFKNPLSHVVLNQGIGRFSPTMARPKAKRRVHKDQLALAVRKNFNAQGVSESDVITQLLYTAKSRDKEFRVRFAPQRK
ncbi:hypothetical protein BU26DRAFT_437524 [Trematosphaeria pertusa]|uniref:Histone deacetylase complex subunit SAP30 Sin3 binding domain-containing protein n=1 Tax=Trematosphaeria pertusa TaxID=390896 RepID=A0A6A6HXT1_9PLEO|nr:uncharacterized protein BU26DRAFT_437524 [Trematosphaeria pertusa]KAF2243024.1 hypothetical protein BU26DRAFT_437524 [Trematosphaeria pertusa]